MTAIVYINQKQLTTHSYPELGSLLLEEFPQHNWMEMAKIFQYNAGVDSNYVRMGKNTLPFKNDYINPAPAYIPGFNMSFNEATDLRYQQLARTHNNKPWLVLWSGGVDSTVVLSSILKNSSIEDRKNIHVACNRISVYEYPDFYYRHLEPNFTIIDSSAIAINQTLLDQYYVIDGEPADQLFVAGSAQNILFSNPELLNNNLRTEPDQLLDILAQTVDRSFAKWHYETMMENINSTNVPLETYYDFFWWHAFNWVWTSINMRSLATQTDTGPVSVRAYLDNFIHWYDTYEYQQWSMNNRINTKCDISRISGNKLPAKDYIYDYTQDTYYRLFKLKLYSTGHQSSQYIAPWFCLLDDHTRLYLDRDLDRILELLPEHINE